MTAKMAPGAGAPYNCVWLHDPDTGRLTHRTFGWLSAFSSPLAGVDYSYDRPGRLTKMDKGLVRWQYQYRAAAPYEMTAVRATNDYGLSKTTSAAIDAYGRTVTKTLGNGVTTAYQYDDSGALTRMAHAGLAGSRSLAYTYQYDKNGNRTKISLADSAGTMSSDTAYAYDALNRLSSEVRTGGSGNFTKAYYYDSVGNRSMLVNVVNGVAELNFYTYNAGEQLTALTKRVNGAVTGSRSYQYDAAGQLTQVADAMGGVTKTFSWDHLGRMAHAEVNSGGVTKSVDYANNPAGKRFMRVAGGVTKAWTYQGDNIASVESTTSPTLHSVYSGSGLGGVAERDDVDTAGGGGTTSRFYLYNHRGDVIGVSDEDGNLTSAYDYDAFGAVSQSAQSGGGSAPTDDILLTGKDLDASTGLYYFNARWYDSETGRFVSRTRDLVDATGLECSVVAPAAGMTIGAMVGASAVVYGLAGAEGGIFAGPGGAATGALVGGTIGAVVGTIGWIAYKVHTSGARPSTAPKHDKGNKRRLQDGKNNNPNMRPPKPEEPAPCPKPSKGNPRPPDIVNPKGKKPPTDW